MKNLKTQIESVRDYAYKRLEEGNFDLITVYYDENIESVRVVVEIDSCRLDLVMLKRFDAMYQAGRWSDVILFNSSTAIPARVRELAEEKRKEYNSNKKELEIKRLEEKLNKLKNQ